MGGQGVLGQGRSCSLCCQLLAWTRAIDACTGLSCYQGLAPPGVHGEHTENHEPGHHQEDVEDQGGDEHVDEVIQVVGEGSGGEVCMAGESEDGVLEHWESLFNPFAPNDDFARRWKSSLVAR